MILFEKTDDGWRSNKTSWDRPRIDPSLGAAIDAMRKNLGLEADRRGRVLPEGWIEVDRTEATPPELRREFALLLLSFALSPRHGPPPHLYVHRETGKPGADGITQAVLVDKRVRLVKPSQTAETSDFHALARVLSLPEPRPTSIVLGPALVRAMGGLDRAREKFVGQTR